MTFLNYINLKYIIIIWDLNLNDLIIFFIKNKIKYLFKINIKKFYIKKALLLIFY